LNTTSLLDQVLGLLRRAHSTIPVVERDKNRSGCRQCADELEATMRSLIVQGVDDAQALSMAFGLRFQTCTCDWDPEEFRCHPRWVRGEA
jgi:hypothetical protein